MDKKKIKRDVIIDDKEDLEIKKVANSKSSNYLLYVLIFLFVIMFSSSLFLINSYYSNKTLEDSLETIEINTKKNKVLITNLGILEKEITKDSFDDNELTLEQVSTINISANKDVKEKSIIAFDVKYNILENDFQRNDISKLESDVLVKFSYSFDNEEWTYINNVISTTESTISPMMGNNYDISGLITNLKVATNYELTANSGEDITMYWRSEVIFKNKETIKEDKKFKSDFKIEYKDNA